MSERVETTTPSARAALAFRPNSLEEESKRVQRGSLRITQHVRYPFYDREERYESSFYQAAYACVINTVRYGLSFGGSRLWGSRLLPRQCFDLLIEPVGRQELDLPASRRHLTSDKPINLTATLSTAVSTELAPLLLPLIRVLLLLRA